MAVVALCFAIAGFIVLPVIGGFLGVVLGSVALRRVNKSAQRRGRPQAIAAIVVGAFALMIGGLLTLAAVFGFVEARKGAQDRAAAYQLHEAMNLVPAFLDQLDEGETGRSMPNGHLYQLNAVSNSPIDISVMTLPGGRTLGAIRAESGRCFGELRDARTGETYYCAKEVNMCRASAFVDSQWRRKPYFTRPS